MRWFTILCRCAAWSLLVLVVFATASPIELRPATETTVSLDRALAFALLGGAFVLGYPRRWRLMLALLPLAAFGIEALQYLDASRHPRLSDAAVKGLGVLAGAGMAACLVRLAARRSRVNQTD